MASQPRKYRIMLAGGGTGGHIFAGLSVLESMRRNHSLEAIFVGTRRGMEARLLTEKGIQVASVDIEGIQGKGWKGWLRFVWLAPRSLWQSLSLLRRFRPDLAIGLGGYSSGPIIWVASWLNIATLLLEPNVLPGMANRRLKNSVDGIAVAFQETTLKLGSRSRVTGIPVRSDFFSCREVPRSPTSFHVLIFGGSQGSHAINCLWLQALPLLLADWQDAWGSLEIMHQTGEKDCSWVREKYRNLSCRAEARPFIEEISKEFGKANLVISRAGAGTIGELCAAGRTGILIPFPKSAEQHQKENARIMASRGAAIMLLEEEADALQLAQQVRSLAGDPQKRQMMESSSAALSRIEAADNIASFAWELIERKAG